MTEFSFRLRFRFPPQSFIAEDTEALTIIAPPDHRQITLQSPPTETLMDAAILDAVAGGFASLDAAITYGRKTREALVICCALLGIGVEMERHEEFIESSQVEFDSESGQPYIRPEDINGLIVYPQNAKVEYYNVQLSTRGGPQGERFQEAFSESFQLSENLDGRLHLAFELFNSHLFETSIRSRFLQLVSAVECLAKRRPQPHAIISHLAYLIELSEHKLVSLDEISSDERNSFIQRLGNLKRESISSACRNLIRQYLGDDAVRQFRAHYDIRSKLIHEGDVSSEIELLDFYAQLKSLTRDLLYALISDNGPRD